jgi:hypothetical protein
MRSDANSGSRPVSVVQMPPDIHRELEATLLGKVQSRLYAAITGSIGLIPDASYKLSYIRAAEREKPGLGELFTVLLFGRVFQTEYSQISEPLSLPRLLTTLEKEPFDALVTLEVHGNPQPLAGTVLVAIDGVAHPGGGRAYRVSIFSNDDTDHAIRLEVHANRRDRDVVVRMLNATGSVDYRMGEVDDDPAVDLALRALRMLQRICRRRRVKRVPPTDRSLEKIVKSDDADGSLGDPDFYNHVSDIRHGISRCTQARIPLSLIQPFDAAYAYAIPDLDIEAFLPNVKDGPEWPLLVYWNGRAYVMSDDYIPFAVYQRMGFDTVPVVIMGDYWSGAGEFGRTGGLELLPAVGLIEAPDVAQVPQKESRLTRWYRYEYRPRIRVPAEEVIALHYLWMKLARLVGSSTTSERDLHALLRSNPVALDAYGQRVFSELRLGRAHRVDLAIQYDQADHTVALVELERASHSIFRKNGRLRDPVDHAVQQVEDWLRWWREHPSEVPEPFDASLPVTGYVVVGRSSDLSEEDRRRLAHLNEGRRVKVITYDDLLERLERLIASIE